MWRSVLTRLDAPARVPDAEHALVSANAVLAATVDMLVGEGSDGDPALRLVAAVEALPGAGRGAVLGPSGPEGTGMTVLAAPGFSDAERAVLTEALRESLPVAPSAANGAGATLPTDLPLPFGLHARLFTFRSQAGWPTLCLALVRPANTDAVAAAALDGLLADLSRLAGVAGDDRRLRDTVSQQRSVLAAIAATAPDAIIRIDRKGRILDFLGKAEAMFGWRSEEIVGQGIERLMPPEHGAQHQTYIENFMRTGERKLPDFGRRLQATHRDGHLFPVEIALSGIEGQEEIEFLGVVRDITRRVQAEQRLDDLRQAMEAASRQSALGEFAASVAHELNQPLAAIANYLDALEIRLEGAEVEAPEALIDLVQKAANQARLGGEIIRRVGRMTKRSEPSRVEDDLHLAVGEALEFVRSAATLSQATLIHETEGEDGRAVFDRVEIQQVVSNLASNALRAMADQTDPRVLIVTSRVTAHEAEIIVADTGPGVPDAVRDSIFDSFVTHSPGGTGLGLAIVKRIANGHDGRVWLEPGQQTGAVFHVVFPRGPVAP